MRGRYGFVRSQNIVFALLRRDRSRRKQIFVIQLLNSHFNFSDNNPMMNYDVNKGHEAVSYIHPVNRPKPHGIMYTSLRDYIFQLKIKINSVCWSISITSMTTLKLKYMYVYLEDKQLRVN